MRTARKLMAVAAVAATATSVVALSTESALAAGATLVVGRASATCASPGYSTISAAVAAASPGDTIQVCPGTYFEHVDVNTPDLTFLGGQAGQDARKKRVKTQATVVSAPNGDFTLSGSASGTTINGFVLQGANLNSHDAVEDFAGSSGLTLVDNVIQLNSNGVNMQNPDGSQPALISQNAFVNNNAGGNPGDNGETGTGVFISNGPANNTQIVDNTFKQHSQTAINFAGDPSRPSTGLVVSDNVSTDDSTFVVATNSSGAVIDHNTVSTTDANVPGPYGHGTGILDFGSNTALRITNNVLKGVGSSTSSGIAVSNFPNFGTTPSLYTDVLSNQVTGYYNDLKVVSGNTTAYVNGNRLASPQNDGIIVQPNVSGVVLSHNTVSGAPHNACEDQTTGTLTAGTANTWLKNTANSPSFPAGICANTATA